MIKHISFSADISLVAALCTSLGYAIASFDNQEKERLVAQSAEKFSDAFQMAFESNMYAAEPFHSYAPFGDGRARLPGYSGPGQP